MPERLTPDSPTAARSGRPRGATAALVLADGSVLWGRGVGAYGSKVGEVCFNTSMTGYQEIITDPSYAGQIITFTFPHVGNVGTNVEDVETTTPAARGVVLRMDPTDPSNFRAMQHLDTWLKSYDLPGIAGVDTRQLTRRIRDAGAPTGVMVHAPDGAIDVEAALAEARAWPGLEGMDLAGEVTTRQAYSWDQTPWKLGDGYGTAGEGARHVVAVDYGAKRNILRQLAGRDCRLTVVPASATAEDILRHKPAGLFLAIRSVMDKGLPVFGICLGHQLLSMALGAETRKMELGHRGANHPVKDLTTGKVEITSQNHGFVVVPESLPADGETTRVSLFDGTIEGVRSTKRRAFSAQYHPEASPGPHDSHYLFDRFIQMIDGKS